MAQNGSSKFHFPEIWHSYLFVGTAGLSSYESQDTSHAAPDVVVAKRQSILPGDVRVKLQFTKAESNTESVVSYKQVVN